MNRNQFEAIRAADACSVGIGVGVACEATMGLEGQYKADCIGPLEKFRERYIHLRDMMFKAIARGDRIAAKAWKLLLDRIPMEVKWADGIENLVVTVGKNLALDTILAGSAYTAACYVGLTGATPTPAAGDTMASHAGWTEVGGANAPTYSGTRKTPSWSAASGGSKATSTAMAFSMTGAGTVGGCFLVYGSGAVATLDSTAGVLYSAGAFTQGNKTVANGDTINVSYTASA